VDAREESRLWAVLKEDPNDVGAFHRLADIVRRKAAEGHEGMDQQRAMDDAVWSLAEELAHSPQAWYPLIELARLSVHDDREASLRRLGTAAERNPTGEALAMGLRTLREAHLPGDALGLGVGHWRPREHDVEAGRQLVEAAVEAGRVGEARRHLEALGLHPDRGRVEPLRAELDRLIARSERDRPRAEPARADPPRGTSRPGGNPEVWSTANTTQTTGPGTGGMPILDPPDVVDLRDPPPAQGSGQDQGGGRQGSGQGKGLLDRLRRR
jgi:hypothetical protein